MGDMKFNGQPLPPQATDVFKNMVMTVTFDRAGHAVQTEVTGVPPTLAEQMKKQGANNSVSYPDKPVKVGDTWSGETDMQGKKVKMTYKLARVETVSGKEAAILEASPEGSTLKLNGPMSISVELATGLPITTKFEVEVNGQKSSVEMTRD